MTRLTQTERAAIREALVAAPDGRIDHDVPMLETRRLQAEAMRRYLNAAWRITGLANLVCAIRRAICRQRTLAALGRLDDAMLRDIGLDRSEIRAAAVASSRDKNPYPATWLSRLGVELERAALRRQTIRELSSLDDRVLRDIGIERGTIQELVNAQFEGRSPTWQLETDDVPAAPGAGVKLGAAILLPFYMMVRKPANGNEEAERRAA